MSVGSASLMRRKPASLSRLPRPGISETLPWVLLVILWILDTSLQPALWSSEQIGLTLANGMALVLVAMAETAVIITRGIDLSVGGMMAISNTLLAREVGGSTTSVLLWCAIVLIIGAAGGALNGILIGVTRLQPFVVTLATWSIFDGIALWILPTTGGSIPNSLITLPLGTWLGLPRTVWFLVLLIAIWAVLARTRSGRAVYALGSDPVAARLSGVSRRKTSIKVYAFSGVCAAAAGIFIATQTASGSPTVGDPFILSAVAATVIGGTSLFGGKGGFAGTVAGAFVFTLINGVTFQLGINSYWGELSQGLLLIVAVALHHATERGARARGRRR